MLDITLTSTFTPPVRCMVRDAYILDRRHHPSGLLRDRDPHQIGVLVLGFSPAITQMVIRRPRRAPHPPRRSSPILP